MIYTLMFGVTILTGDYINTNILPGLCSLVTGDRYEIIPFNDWAVLSNSPRVFWGQRYNKLVNTILKESVFQPLAELGVSSQVAAITSFAVSGLLHLHVAHAVFTQGTATAFAFFVIHGVACVVDVKLKWKSWPKPIGWAANMGLMAITLPLYLGLFVRASPAWLVNNPLSVTVPPHLKLPVPAICF
jgi:Membrane bound O-acyl transferase family